MIWRKRERKLQHLIFWVKDIREVETTEWWDLLEIIHKCLSTKLAIFYLRADNRGLGDISFSSSLFTTLSAYMNIENCWHNYECPFDPKYAGEKTTKNI